MGLAISCSKIGQKPPKTKYLQNICANAKTTNNWAEVRMVSDSDIKFMPLSKLNRGYNGYLRSANTGSGMFHRAPSLIPAGPDYKLPNYKLLAFQFGLEGGEPAHEGSKAHYDLA